MKKNAKHKFLVMLDEMISSEILDDFVHGGQDKTSVSGFNDRESGSVDKAGFMFVDLYRELVDKFKIDKPPCVKCPDSIINECSKTARECMTFKKYLSKGYCA